MLLSRNCLPEQESRICLHLELFGHGGEMERGESSWERTVKWRDSGDNLASQNIYVLKVIPSLTLTSRLEVDFPGNKVKSVWGAGFLPFLSSMDLVRGEGAGMARPVPGTSFRIWWVSPCFKRQSSYYEMPHLFFSHLCHAIWKLFGCTMFSSSTVSLLQKP